MIQLTLTPSLFSRWISYIHIIDNQAYNNMVHVVNIKYSQILENYSYSKIKDEAEVLAFLLLSDYGR